MKTLSMTWSVRARAALALALAASPAAAQTSESAVSGASGVSAPVAPVTGTTGVGAGTTPTTSLTTNLTGTGFAPSAPLGMRAAAVGAAPSAVGAAAVAPGPAAVPGAVGVPATDVSPQAATPSGIAGPTAPTAANSSLGGGEIAPGSARAAARGASADGGSSVAAPSAGRTLNGAAGRVSAAASIEAAGGDEQSVRAALGKVFDAESLSGAAVDRPTPGSRLTARDKISQEVGIANTASPADAPGLYLDALKTAQDTLPAAAAAAVAGVVRAYAARKADLSLDALAAQAYAAAAGGSEKETSRVLSAFDKWESVLGAPGRPLVANAESLKSDVRSFLSPEIDAKAGARRTAPHVWFKHEGDTYVAQLPSASRVTRLPAALAAGFALKADALAPLSPLADAYRAFAAAPGAFTGAGVVYGARRALGSSVPSAAIAATRFWLSALLETLWRKLAALFAAAPSYDVSRRDGQDALRRAAQLGGVARDAAASALRLVSSQRRTVGDARAAFAAAARSAAAFDALNGESVSRSIAALQGLFVAATDGQEASAPLSARAAASVDGPGGLADWAARLEKLSAVDAARVPATAALVNLGADAGAAVQTAALARAVGADAAFVALDDQLWARGRGESGEVRLSASLRASDAGGSVALAAPRGDAELARRLSDLGFAVTLDGSGLRAELGPDGFGRGADELGLLAARGLAAALKPARAADPALSALSAAVRRDRAAAADLARRLDGRAPFAGARVIGLVGPDEALAPVAASVGRRAVMVSALRDPGTGLLDFAVPLAANGAPLAPAELRALLLAR